MIGSISFSFLQDSKGKCPLFIPGPQNGWNDPPALNRVPKKKKVLEKDVHPVTYRCYVNHIATWSTPHSLIHLKAKLMDLFKAYFSMYFLINGKK